MCPRPPLWRFVCQRLQSPRSYGFIGEPPFISMMCPLRCQPQQEEDSVLQDCADGQLMCTEGGDKASR